MKFHVIIIIAMVCLLTAPGTAISVDHNDNENAEEQDNKIISSRNLADSQWPMYKGNAQHTGLSPYDTKDNLGKITWSFAVEEGIGTSAVVGSDGTIYFGSKDNYLYALYADGKLRWKFKTENRIYSSPALDSNGNIYFGSYDNYFYALDPDGALKWKFKTGDIIYSSPVIGNGNTIYFGSHDNYLYALNPDGSLKWKFKTNDDAQGSPAIGHNGIIYHLSETYFLYAIHPNGSLKWKYDSEDSYLGSHTSPVIGSDDVIYFSGNEHNFYAVYPNCSLKWKFKTREIGGLGNEGVPFTPSIDKSGNIYFCCADGYLYSLDPNGDLRWNKYYYTTYGNSPVISNDGILYITGNLGLYSIYLNGTEKWHIRDEFGGRIAIGADGTLYMETVYGLSAVYRSRPTPPQDFNGVAIGDHINLGWFEPEDDCGGKITGYRIYRWEDTIKGELTIYNITDTSKLYFVDYDLKPSTRYIYGITALNEYGESDFYEDVFRENIEVYSLPLPSAPFEKQAVVEDNTIKLTWKSIVLRYDSPFLGFNIYRGDEPGEESLIASVDRNINYYVDENIIMGQNYSYIITSFNGLGESASYPFSVLAVTEPSEVLLQDVVEGENYIELYWRPPADNGGSPITEYRLYKGYFDDSLDLVTTFNSTILTYYDDDVEYRRDYYYQIVAVNEIGEGEAVEILKINIIEKEEEGEKEKDVELEEGDGSEYAVNEESHLILDASIVIIIILIIIFNILIAHDKRKNQIS